MSKRVVHRSSVSGRFVTEKFAGKHKRETEREVVRTPQPAKPTPKGGS